MMPKALDGQIVMEKTPRYFVTVETPARVHAMSKDVKLIVVVRDPVTRAISDYTQIISKTPNIPAFESLAFKNRSTGAAEPLYPHCKLDHVYDEFPYLSVEKNQLCLFAAKQEMML